MLGLIAVSLFSGCLFAPPVDGPVVRPFAPEGRYGGHWGLDLAVPVGTPVRAAAPGVITFSGSVAGMESVTVDHGGGLRTSYSYLTARFVTSGDRVAQGAVVGSSGIDHGVPALHFSVRVWGRYVDPARVCGRLMPGDGLRLVA